MRSDNKIPGVGAVVNGRKFLGNIEVRDSGGHKRNYILIKCLNCGIEKYIESKQFRKGSCRCCSKNHKVKHGFLCKQGDNRFYHTYRGILRRCNDKKSRRYYLYGGRGISCERKTFEEFRDDMYESYVRHKEKFGERQTTIDRIDNNGNYCKENCRWATPAIQTQNRGATNKVVIGGIQYDVWSISTLCHISKDTASRRLRKYIDGIITEEQLFQKKKTSTTA